MTYLSTVVQAFFTDYVHTQRNLSANTIKSYRDTWRLLVKHASAATGLGIDRLRIEDVTPDLVTAFLDHLATVRGNSPATRSTRLAAVRALLAYASPDYPEHADHARRILAIKLAKTSKPLITYLDAAETVALLAAPDTQTWIGRRDQAMLSLAIATGLRISELLALTTTSIRTGASPHVECLGKGRKHRRTPLDAATSQLLAGYLKERSHRPGTALFPGPRGGPLSRDAIERRLAAAVKAATASCPSLVGKRVTMHTLRHTTAMNLLRAGVDITVIALWLGHEQTATTDVYLHADDQAKRDALDKTRPINVEPGTYTPSPDLLTWLEAL